MRILVTGAAGFIGGFRVSINDPNDSDVLDLQSELWDEKRKISGAKIVESFSGLSNQVGFDGRDLDCVQEGQGQQGDLIGLEQMPIFNFPAGANAGNFMHDVFEHLDFLDSYLFHYC